MSTVAEKNRGEVSGKAQSSIVTLMKKKLAEKRAIDQYLSGQISLEELYARGIKFVQPI